MKMRPRIHISMGIPEANKKLAISNKCPKVGEISPPNQLALRSWGEGLRFRPRDTLSEYTLRRWRISGAEKRSLAICTFMLPVLQALKLQSTIQPKTP
jgi:hypothetical protein